MAKKNVSNIISICCIISFFLYYFAPYGFNPLYCGGTAAMFLIETYYVCRIDWANKLFFSFNTLFSFSFFLTSFGFALFVQDSTGETLSVLAGIVVDFNLMPKCCSLCLIAYSLYSLFYVRKINVSINSKQDVLFLPAIKASLTIPLFYLTFILLFVKTLVFFRTTGDINMNEDTYLVSLFECMLPVALIINIAKKPCTNINSFVKNNLSILLPTCMVMILYIVMGDRGIIIVCAATILMVYTLLVQRVRLKIIIFVALTGVILMFVIRQTRVSESALSSGSISSFAEASNNAIRDASGVIALFSDLTGSVQELCLGYQFKQQKGMLDPVEQLIMLPTYPFPLIPTFVASTFFGKVPSDYGTGECLNHFVSSVGDGKYGNHVVIDIYMTWGLLGVIIAFSIFGNFIAFISNRYNNNIKYLAIYLVLTGLAIYTPRNTLPYLIRPIAYSYFFIWFLTRKKI